MARALREGRPIRGEEIMIERPDGVKLNLLPHPDPIFDSSGQIVEAVNMLLDITTIRENEKELKDNLKKAMEIANDLYEQVNAKTRDLSDANALLKLANDELEQLRSMRFRY